MTKRLLLMLAVGAVMATAACSLDSTSSYTCSMPDHASTVRGDTVVMTYTGLKYIDDLANKGSGDSVTTCVPANVSYVLRIAGDTTSKIIDQGTITVVPGSGGAIPGFEQGIVGMKVGGKRLLIIPPDLGYGSQAKTDVNGNVVIPPNSTLLFDVTVNSVGSSTS